MKSGGGETEAQIREGDKPSVREKDMIKERESYERRTKINIKLLCAGEIVEALHRIVVR